MEQYFIKVGELYIANYPTVSENNGTTVIQYIELINDKTKARLFRDMDYAKSIAGLLNGITYKKIVTVDEEPV
ncbi:hypothetical protein [Pseudobacillus badius]|uniref:hypothetical protein n=1 Tax=Bacillus badius TaxID=1455 RepID=UPI001CBAAED6|nr:hypothetical protein [Bacillus badius]UAT29430.1 hypothetical protein K7T73_12550 [Bacillus badius]GLY11396.1 hypothetical protein Bbad01_26120 [Bacillus badius]